MSQPNRRFDETDGVLPMGDSGHLPVGFSHPDEDDGMPEPYRVSRSGDGTYIVRDIGTGSIARSGLCLGDALTLAARLNDGARFVARSLPAGLGEEDADVDEVAIESSFLGGHDPLHAAGASMADETRERIARSNDQHVPLRVQLRQAAHRMTTGVESDGCVRVPRAIGHLIAAWVLHHVDSIPMGATTCEQAFDRGWMGGER